MRKVFIKFQVSCTKTAFVEHKTEEKTYVDSVIEILRHQFF